MTKAKVQEIYGLLETKQEAIEQDGLVEIKDEAVARLIIETNPENALEMKNNPTSETELNYAVVRDILSKYPHTAVAPKFGNHQQTHFCNSRWS